MKKVEKVKKSKKKKEIIDELSESDDFKFSQRIINLCLWYQIEDSRNMIRLFGSEIKMYEIQKQVLLIEKNGIEKKINQKDSISQGMYEDLKTGIIEYEEYKVFKENFKNEKNTLVTRLEIVNKQLSELENAEFNFEEAGKVFEKYNSIKEVTREIINEFIEKIIIGEYNPNTNSRDIKIKWRYQF